MWNLDSQTQIKLDYKKNVHKHDDLICCFAKGLISKKSVNYKEVYEYLFASGYDGRISIWEISQDSNLHSNIISPQLKSILFTLNLNQNQNQNQNIYLNQNQNNSSGDEILALAFYSSS